MNARMAAEASVPSPAAGPLELRVLLVEDDPLDARLALDALHGDGITVEHRVVEHREDFLAALAGFHPDIVLSDVSLPGFSGYEALRLLRGRDRHLPFVFVSGTIGEGTAIEALRAGATDYILKSHSARLPVAVRRAVAEAEERRARDAAEAELVRGQRYQTLALLAGSLGHDLRNTLQPVLMATSMIENRSHDADVVRYCTTIRGCLQQSLALVRAMLDLASGASSGTHGGLVRVGALVDAAVLLARPTLRGEVVLDISAIDPALELPGDAMELQQCVLNLLLNAVQSIDGPGRVRIEAVPVQLDTGFLREGEDLHGDRYLRLSISDSGRGMDADTLAQLFTPFFTTRTGGTGLGLVSCRRCVERHRGLMRVHSEPGRGSRFDILLPLQPPPQPQRAGDVDDAPGHGECIAVLGGDEREVRQIADILELYGYGALALADIADLEHTATPPLVLFAAHGSLRAGNVLARLRAIGIDCPVLSFGKRDAVPLGGTAGHLAAPLNAPILLRALAELLPAPPPHGD